MISKLLNLFKKEPSESLVDNPSNSNNKKVEVQKSTLNEHVKNSTDTKTQTEQINKKGKELIERLEHLHEKIKAKTIEQLTEGEEGSQFLIDQLQYDATSVAQAWSGIKHQVYHKMQEKIQDSWTKFAQLTDFETDKIDLRKESYRRGEMSYWLDITYHEYEVRTLAKAAHRLWDNAQKEETTNEFNCVSCGSGITLGKYIFHSRNCKCQHCGFVNTYSPSEKVVMARGYAIQWLLDEAALKDWHEMKQAEYNVKTASDFGNKPSFDLLDTYEEKIHNYWTTFYKNRDELNPDLAIHSKEVLTSKFEWGYKEIKSYNKLWEPKIFKSFS